VSRLRWSRARCRPDYHEQILAACAAAGFAPDTLHELQHWLSVVSLVAQGLGVAKADAGRPALEAFAQAVRQVAERQA
jgi:hypothetical protein